MLNKKISTMEKIEYMQKFIEKRNQQSQSIDPSSVKKVKFEDLKKRNRIVAT